MEAPLTVYRSSLADLEPCSEAWFGEALQRARAGDKEARRRISGSCLKLAMQVAERGTDHPTEEELLERIQDANNGLWLSIGTFRGSTSEEFLRHAEQAIQDYLNRQHV